MKKKYLNLIVELSSWKKLKYNIKGILGFKNLFQFHEILVMELPHHLNFFYQALLSVLLTVGDFFWERLHCVLLLILFFPHKVNSGEVPLSDFANRLELLMEAPLI